MSQHQAFKRVAVPPQVAVKQEMITFPAPTRGLIMSENESYMQPGAAVVCDNWAPTMKGAKIRGGHELWVDLYPSSVETAAFLARTSGLDVTHTSAYTALIDGLVAGGLWTKFDMLHIYATQTSATALLNLIQNNYNGVIHGAPTFTVDRGFTGVDLSTTVYIDTGFNPTTASSPHFIKDNAHLSTWSLTSGQDAAAPIGAYNAGPTASTYILNRYTDNTAYFRVNTTTALGLDGAANLNGTGFYLGARGGAPSGIEGYRNTTQLVGQITASTLLNANIYTLGINGAGTAAGFGGQLTMASIGSRLSPAEVTTFYNLLRTYMTAVGVP